MMFLVFLHDQVSKMILVVDYLENLSIFREDKVSSVISREGYGELNPASPAIDGAGMCGRISSILGIKVIHETVLHSLASYLALYRFMHIFISKSHGLNKISWGALQQL